MKKIGGISLLHRDPQRLMKMFLRIVGLNSSQRAVNKLSQLDSGQLGLGLALGSTLDKGRIHVWVACPDPL